MQRALRTSVLRARAAAPIGRRWMSDMNPAVVRNAIDEIKAELANPQIEYTEAELRADFAAGKIDTAKINKMYADFPEEMKKARGPTPAPRLPPTPLPRSPLLTCPSPIHLPHAVSAGGAQIGQRD